MAVEMLRNNKKPKLNVTRNKDLCKGIKGGQLLRVQGLGINVHHLTRADKRALRGREA